MKREAREARCDGQAIFVVISLLSKIKKDDRVKKSFPYLVIVNQDLNCLGVTHYRGFGGETGFHSI